MVGAAVVVMGLPPLASRPEPDRSAVSVGTTVGTLVVIVVKPAAFITAPPQVGAVAVVGTVVVVGAVAVGAGAVGTAAM